MWRLGLRSFLVLAILFGLLFAVGIAALYTTGQPMWTAVVFAVVVVGLQYLIGPTIIQWIYKINWIDAREVDPNLASFIEATSSKYGIPIPRFGIIEDGNPNAFTFGHYPGNARVVVTRGLVDILSPRERNAVVAHELGHIKHWDFVVMTIAGLVPLLLYILYRWTSRRDDQASSAVALGAFLAYIVSQFIVLLLSRIREYFADDFAADATGDPGALSLALVKIGYGISKAGKPPEKEQKDGKKKGFFARIKNKGKKKSRGFDKGGAFAALGIASEKSSVGSVLSGIGSERRFDAGAMAAAMEWDLKNPWAFIYQLNSTHPLTARRVLAMNKKSLAGGTTPLIALSEKKAEGLTGAFLIDLLFWAMPVIGLAIAAVIAGLLAAYVPKAASLAPGIFFLLAGAGFIVRLLFRYNTKFEPKTVTSLLRELKVSKMRPIPVQMRGTIIGHGIPGLYWSEDLVLQDETGFIVLDYRQPIRLLDFIFGLRKADKFQGKEATVTGWYRRGMRPFVELYKVEAGDLTGRTWTYNLKLVIALILSVIGLFLLLSGITALVM